MQGFKLYENGLPHLSYAPTACTEVPPKVEYFLPDYGKSLRPITKVMCEWGQKRIKPRNKSSKAVITDDWSNMIVTPK